MTEQLADQVLTARRVAAPVVGEHQERAGGRRHSVIMRPAPGLSNRPRMTFAGTPPAITFSGIGRVTTDPAAMMGDPEGGGAEGDAPNEDVAQSDTSGYTGDSGAQAA